MNEARLKLFNGCPDLVFFAILIFASLVAWSIHSISEKLPANRSFIIKIIGENGEHRQEVANKRNEKLAVSGKLGQVTIEWDNNGRVRIASSSCPCQTCVNMGWSSYSSLICVPGGVMVEPQATEDTIDAVTR